MAEKEKIQHQHYQPYHVFKVCADMHAVQWLSVMEMCERILQHFFSKIMYMCVFIHMDVLVTITDFDSMPIYGSMHSQAVLTLAFLYATRMAQVSAGDEISIRINERERGHCCQRRIRV